MRPWTPVLALTPLFPLAACGPVPLEQAEQQCLEQARAAMGPTGSASVAIDSHGNVATGFTLGISSDYLLGRDPQKVYDECVYRMSGQMPTVKLYIPPKQ